MYNFVWSYSDQGTEGLVKRDYTTNVEPLEVALEEFREFMNCKDYQSFNWVLIGTTINGVDAQKFIKDNTVKQDDTHNLFVSDTKVADAIPTPIELAKRKKSMVTEKFLKPCVDTIVKAMLSGESYALIKTSDEIDKNWDILYSTLSVEFLRKGWVLGYKNFKRQEGPDMQPYTQTYYQISWSEQARDEDYGR